MNRKTLAIFLSLAMILSLLAANGLAFAEDAHPEAPAEEPQVVEVEEKTEEPAAPAVEAESEEKAEENTEAEPVEGEEPAEEAKTPAEEPEEVEDEVAEPVVTEPEEKEGEVTEEPAEEEVETPAEETETEAPAEGEEPAGEEQPGEEPVDPEEPVVDVPVAPVNPEEVELDPEAPVTNPEVNDVVGGGNAGVEGLPVVPEVPQQPVCSCGVNEGEAHEEGCPMYEAPAQPAPAPECTCGAEGDAHAEDCPLYVAPVVPAVPVEGCTCGTVSEDPQDHDVDCPVFLATINRLPAQVKHSELYLKIMACETYSEVVELVENATEEEILELSEDEIDEINAILKAFSDSKVSEPELPEGIFTEDEIVESEIRFVMDEESETAVAAPFLPPVKGE